MVTFIFVNIEDERAEFNRNYDRIYPELEGVIAAERSTPHRTARPTRLTSSRIVMLVLILCQSAYEAPDLG